MIKTFSTSEQETLHNALHFMKMDELRNVCYMLGIIETGKKAALIKRIMTFVTTGKIVQPIAIPPESQAKNYPPQPLKLSSLILHGGYKNDLATRTFFKKIIGSHFHFTAYGIDWIEERWLASNPPTYQEFVDYWTEETNRRKNQKVDPKDEWRFIRFVQEMNNKSPNIPHDEIMRAWKQEQTKQAATVLALLKNILKL